MRSMQISRILDELTARGVGSLTCCLRIIQSLVSLGPWHSPNIIIPARNLCCRKETETSQRVLEAYRAVILISILGGALRDELVLAGITPTPDDPQP